MAKGIFKLEVLCRDGSSDTWRLSRLLGSAMIRTRDMVASIAIRRGCNSRKPAFEPRAFARFYSLCFWSADLLNKSEP